MTQEQAIKLVKREHKFRAFGNFSGVGPTMEYCWEMLEEFRRVVKIPFAGNEWFTKMQWTGLQDVNGQDIYEGDIYTIGGIKTYLVAFRHGYFYGKCIQELKVIMGLDDFVSSIQIIGNIFENPELLEDI